MYIWSGGRGSFLGWPHSQIYVYSLRTIGGGDSNSIVAVGYLLDVLLGQTIKLIQVASNSELRENQWNDLLFFEIVPSHCFGASEASKIEYFKN